MSDTTSTNPSEKPYDPAEDPDSDPQSLGAKEPTQPDQAEGDDDPAEYTS
ncbi:hypothetical protein [Sanguibacter suaedae]|uniref:Uncharacterized protein n=1 Tax=Sanguibacter suaedae TaxID=2795737 RepID=A0A934I0U6_9MICO|nr:hypothetical protein [Sanguibacter suaedae]MBI9113494.1 hypothetical protein [Sanguibacter suaedae]